MTASTASGMQPNTAVQPYANQLPQPPQQSNAHQPSVTPPQPLHQQQQPSQQQWQVVTEGFPYQSNQPPPQLLQPSARQVQPQEQSQLQSQQQNQQLNQQQLQRYQAQTVQQGQLQQVQQQEQQPQEQRQVVSSYAVNLLSSRGYQAGTNSASQSHSPLTQSHRQYPAVQAMAGAGPGPDAARIASASGRGAVINPTATSSGGGGSSGSGMYLSPLQLLEEHVAAMPFAIELLQREQQHRAASLERRMKQQQQSQLRSKGGLGIPYPSLPRSTTTQQPEAQLSRASTFNYYTRLNSAAPMSTGRSSGGLHGGMLRSSLLHSPSPSTAVYASVGGAHARSTSSSLSGILAPRAPLAASGPTHPWAQHKYV